MKCPVCGAAPGEACVNPIRPGEPLPGRVDHIGRYERFYCRRCGMPQPANHDCGRDK